jgi:hypothetical protein
MLLAYNDCILWSRIQYKQWTLHFLFVSKPHANVKVYTFLKLETVFKLDTRNASDVSK